MTLLCVTLPLLLHHMWSLGALSASNGINIDDCQQIETIIDSRNQPPYQYSNENHQICTMSPFQSITIDFDLRIKNIALFRGTHILLFESSTCRLTFYLNGFGEFGIVHYNAELDGLDEQQLLDFNLVLGRQQMKS